MQEPTSNWLSLLIYAVRLRWLDGRLLTYRDILNYYREGRRSYPGPHQFLDRKQAVALRLLQTNSFPKPVLYHQMYPYLYEPKCKFCSGWATLSHMMWKCPHIATNPHEHSTYFLNIHNDVQWETALHSSTAEDQQALVRIARKATDSHGVGRILAGKKTQDQSSYSGPINSCLSISLDAWMQSNAIRQASHGQACLGIWFWKTDTWGHCCKKETRWTQWMLKCTFKL